eukprot:TRINITY_DN11539_c0_g1_i1.p1 TRINITY_DN11539_c0_g1~~TRINITY_DN11539_c0_g1_i1.p1  ORF type:complete len:1743 (+),score=489.45 TRINITY_DN11539_c0_g1_i1:122-5230(+)
MDVQSQEALSEADFQAALLPKERAVPSSVTDWFRRNRARMEFEDFLPWVREHGESMQATAWVLKGRTDTLRTSGVLSYYATLEEHTGMSVDDIKGVERKFHQLYTTCKRNVYDRKSFLDHSCPPLSEALASRWFQIMDVDKNGDLSLLELLQGVANSCCGAKADRLKALFAWFDVSNSSHLGESEVFGMLNAVHDLRKALISPRQPGPISVSHASSGRRSTVASVNFTLKEDAIEATTLFSSASSQPEVASVAADLLSSKFCKDVAHGLSAEELVDWAMQTRHLDPILDALDQYKHLVLCLRPESPEAEGAVIQSAMRRHKPKSLELGEDRHTPRAYLIATTWWKQWLAYVGKGKKSAGRKDSSASRSGPSSPRKVPRMRRASSTGTSQADTSSSRNRSGSLSNPLPPAIDNLNLLAPIHSKHVPSEWGPKLRPDVAMDRDFKLLSAEIWEALLTWYGGGPPIPRPLFRETNGNVSVEVHPLTIKILHYTTKTKLLSGLAAKLTGGDADNKEDEKLHTSLWFCTECSFNDTIGQVVKSVVKAQARMPDGRRSASDKGARLWDYTNAKQPVLLSDPRLKVTQAGLRDEHPLLLEIRNADLSWPSEMLAVARANALSEGGVEDVTMDPAAVDKADGKGRIKGLTGLSNLGNTCFMNAALQCLSHTSPLTEYFLYQRQFMELNIDKPLGHKGVVAKRYGELVKQLYAGRRSVAPLKLRSAIQDLAPLFAGNQQQDAQELLAFVLDGLHEDLNRVTEKPYVERKDSDNRPDPIVAKEHWENHVARNRSIMVDLFHFQLRSQVQCLDCGLTSVTFDPVSSLPLPLPSEGACTVELSLQRLNGRPPTKYALEVEPDCDYGTIKRTLARVSGLTPEQMVVVDVVRGSIARVLMDRERCLGGGRQTIRVFEVDLGAKMAGFAAINALRGYRRESVSSTTGEVVPVLDDKAEQSPSSKALNGKHKARTASTASATIEEDVPTPTMPRNKEAATIDEEQMESNGNGKMSAAVNPKPVDIQGGHSTENGYNKFEDDGRTPAQREMNGHEEGDDDGNSPKDGDEQEAHANGNGDSLQEANTVTVVKPKHSGNSSVRENGHNDHSRPNDTEQDQVDQASNVEDNQGQVTLVPSSPEHKPRSASMTQAPNAKRTPNGLTPPLAPKNTTVSAPVTPAKRGSITYPTMPGADGKAAELRKLVGEARRDQYVVGHLIALQRKWQALNTHFLCRPARPVTLGQSILIPYKQNVTTYAELYSRAWSQVKRFVDQSLRAKVDQTKEYPFKITLVSRLNTSACSECPWYNYCTGCARSATDDKVDLAFSQLISLDWDHKLYNLHYQHGQEYSHSKDKSLKDMKAKANSAVTIDDCIKSFIKEEKMEKEDQWYCSACKTHRLARKKLDIWTMPPFLIVHLKRFQMVNGGWRKSNKRVVMPLTDFDPLRFSPHVQQPNADKPKLRLLGMDLTESSTDAVESSTDADNVEVADNVDNVDNVDGATTTEASGSTSLTNGHDKVDQAVTTTSISNQSPHETETASEALPTADTESQSPAVDAPNAEKASEHANKPQADALSTDQDEDDKEAEDNEEAQEDEQALEIDPELPLYTALDPHKDVYQDPKEPRLYDLYAVTCHMGMLGGGHYVAYIKGSNGKWYLFNDSSCREVDEEEVVKESRHAYMLFYQAKNLDEDKFLPPLDEAKIAAAAEEAAIHDRRKDQTCSVM